MEDYKAEFDKLKKEWEETEQQLQFDTNEDILNWLAEFAPLEYFFKKMYHIGGEYDFWNFPNYYYENFKFNFQYESANIRVARHLRYDKQVFHAHDFFQINYCLRGECTVNTNTKRCVAVKMRRGDFNLLAPETPHHISVFSDDCIMLKFYIRKSTFERTFFKWLDGDDILSGFFKSAIRGGKNAYINFRTGADKTVEEIILSLYRELFNHRAYCGIISESKLTELFCLLVREHMNSAETLFDDRKQNGASAGIIAYMHENYRDTSLEIAARDLGYSKNYFCRLISKKMGKTFCELLNEIRVSEAKKMLVATNESVSAVGRAVGYNSDEHFHRVFKEFCGISPREWIKSIKEAE